MARNAVIKDPGTWGLRGITQVWVEGGNVVVVSTFLEWALLEDGTEVPRHALVDGDEKEMDKMARPVNAIRTAYMKGWDAQLSGEFRGNNPYTLADLRRVWEQGFNHCKQGRELPWWYEEWRQSRAGRRYCESEA